MRYVIARKNEYPKSSKVSKVLSEEINNGFLDIDLYMRFKSNCLRSKERLNDLIELSLKIKELEDTLQRQKAQLF